MKTLQRKRGLNQHYKWVRNSAGGRAGVTEDLRQREAIKRAAISNNAGQTGRGRLWGMGSCCTHCSLCYAMVSSPNHLSTLSVWTACFSLAFLTKVCPLAPGPFLRLPSSIFLSSSFCPVHSSYLGQSAPAGQDWVWFRHVQSQEDTSSLSVAPVDCSIATSVTLRLRIFLVEGDYTCVLNKNNMQGSKLILLEATPARMLQGQVCAMFLGLAYRSTSDPGPQSFHGGSSVVTGFMP